MKSACDECGHDWTTIEGETYQNDILEVGIITKKVKCYVCGKFGTERYTYEGTQEDVREE